MATIHEASTEELPRHLEGVNGWLLFFCVTTTIFAPILYITAAFQSASPVEGVIELLFGVFAAVTGGFVWSIQAQALRLLRIYLVLALCLAGLGCQVAQRGELDFLRPMLGRVDGPDDTRNPPLSP